MKRITTTLALVAILLPGAALAAPALNTFGGFTGWKGWRLPSINELKKGWQVSLTGADGQPLQKTEVKSGGTFPALVLGGTYVVSATVPSALRWELAGETVELQQRSGVAGEWTTVKEVRVGADGRIREEFTAGKELIHRHAYRIAVMESGASGSSRATKGAAARPAQSSTTTSETTTAVGVVQFIVQVVNNTGNNLNLYVPGTFDGSTYGEGEVALAIGDTISLIYTNPPPGAGLHIRANKADCLLGCTNFVTNWKWVPSDYNLTACGASMPQFFSNQLYLMELNDKMFNDSHFAAGLLSGQIYGDGTGYNTCTFDLDSTFDNWFLSNPVEGFLLIEATTAAIVIAVAATVALGPLAAPVDGAVGELIVGGLVDVAGEGAAGDGAAALDEAAQPQINQAAGAQPNPVNAEFFIGAFIQPPPPPNVVALF
ncbi:MAG: hypothetical protein ACKPBU_05510 [Alphaproteobacteria bacterium]